MKNWAAEEVVCELPARSGGGGGASEARRAERGWERACARESQSVWLIFFSDVHALHVNPFPQPAESWLAGLHAPDPPPQATG